MFLQNYNLFHQKMKSLFDGLEVFDWNNKKHKEGVTMLFKMQNRYLITEGFQLKVDINRMNIFFTKLYLPLEKKSAQVSRDFIANEFLTFYNEHGNQFQQYVFHDLILYTMHVIKGQKNHKISEKGMIF